MALNADLDTAERGEEQSSKRPSSKLRATHVEFEELDADESVLRQHISNHVNEDVGKGRSRMQTYARQSFWQRMDIPSEMPGRESEFQDRYFDYAEDSSSRAEMSFGIPTLEECQQRLKNEEADAYRKRSMTVVQRLWDTVLNIVAALYIWSINMLGFESALVVTNSALAAMFYCRNYERYASKLDFAFLAFAVVFPLTFLITAVFGRRDAALSRLVDFKAAVLSTVLFTLSCDWGTNGNLSGGRLNLPRHFEINVVKDYRELVQLVYEYLSMPGVSHARNIVFGFKRTATRRVHALQNDVYKRLNDVMFDLSMHTEEMRKCGFPSGEASRLHQYHQYLQQRFEHLRSLKYYRTPQATRSFGRAYIFILPWISGPYTAWVFEEVNQSYPYAITLSSFTSLVVFGLLNTQQELEDPFFVEYRSWLPGIDAVKLDYELATTLQTMEQYLASAKQQRTWQQVREIKKKRGKHQEPEKQYSS